MGDDDGLFRSRGGAPGRTATCVVLGSARGGTSMTLWAGYETALQNPLAFVDAVAAFAGLEPTVERRTIAAGCISPARRSGNVDLIAEDLQRVARAVDSRA